MANINLSTLSLTEIQELMEKLESRKTQIVDNDRPMANARLGEIKNQLSSLFAEIETICNQYDLDFYFTAPNDTSINFYGEDGTGWYSSY